VKRSENSRRRTIKEQKKVEESRGKGLNRKSRKERKH